jgi:transglutaminase-like putative cysteine protease
VIRTTRTRTLLVSLCLAAAATVLTAAEPAGRLRIGKVHRLRVTHTTRVRIEADTTRLDLWHAKPQDRDWPGIKAPLAVEKVSFTPTGATELPTRSEGGLAWRWRVPDPAAGETDYVSTFELLSADRDLKTSGLEIRWADLPKDMTESMKGLPALPTPNERVREAYASIRKKAKDVIDAVTAITQWINANIAYTPAVTYATDNLEAICRGGGGHCGHRATVFLAFCQAAGIPARRVVGYALINKPAGATGTDDSNRHVWAQVNLPGLGWVEVEPAPHGSPFAISYQFVMCPFDLQARFAIAVSKGGPEKQPVLTDTLHMDELK